MITEQKDYDLKILSEHFTECGDYTKDVILEELEYWKKSTDFLVLISESDNGIDGFLIGYRNRNSLWLAQGWRKSGCDLKTSRQAMAMAGEWAKERSMTSMTSEVERNEMRAMGRYGFKEESVNMKAVL